MIHLLPCLARYRRYRQARFARRDLVNVRYFRDRWKWKEEVGGISYAAYCSDRYELEQWERKLTQSWGGTQYYPLFVLAIERAYRNLEKARAASEDFAHEPKPTRISYKSDRQLGIEAAFARLGVTYAEDAQVWVETNKDGVTTQFVPVSHDQLAKIEREYNPNEIAVFSLRKVEEKGKTTRAFDVSFRNISEATMTRAVRVWRAFYGIGTTKLPAHESSQLDDLQFEGLSKEIESQQVGLPSPDRQG